MRKKLIIGGIIIVALVALRLLYVGLQPAPPDVERVRDLIEQARVGAEEGEPNRITDAIAESARVQGMTGEQVRRWIRQSISNADDLQVQLTPPAIRVDGGRATADIATMRISFTYLGRHEDFEVKDLHIRLEKRPARKWLVLPSDQWRIVSAEASRVPTLDLFY